MPEKIMLKLLGLLCIVLCGAAAGGAASLQLKRKAEYCSKTSMLLHETASIMRFSCETLPVLISSLAYRESFRQLSFLKTASERMEEGIAFPAAWEEGISGDKCLAPELRQLLAPLSESLGASDIDGQLRTLGFAEEQIRELYLRTQEQYSKKGRLCRCLGILGGISAALLLC